MALTDRAVSVGTTATRLDSDDNQFETDLSTVCITNVGASTIYVGAATVATTSGTPVAAGSTLAIDLKPHNKLYGRVASGTVEARILEQV